MTHHDNLKILAFVGLTGSGRTSAVEYFSGKGIPKVHGDDLAKQINDLAASGQHRIVLESVHTVDSYKELRHLFPGELTLVAIVAPKHKRYRWLESRLERPLAQDVANESDNKKASDTQKAGLLISADFYVANDGSIEDFYKKLDALTDELDF